VANLKSDANRTYLNAVWWVLEPALNMLAYYLVFGFLLNRGEEDFAVFLLVGLVPWLWFQKSILNGMNSIVHGQRLIQQVSIKKWFFPAVSVGQDGFKQSIGFILLFVFLIVYGVNPSIHWLGFFPIVCVELLLILGVTFFIASIIPFLFDLKFFVSAITQLLMLCSGIFYSLEAIPEVFQQYFLVNPMAFIIFESRNVLLYRNWPDWWHLFELGVVGVLLLATALKILQLNDKIYPRVTL